MARHVNKVCASIEIKYQTKLQKETKRMNFHYKYSKRLLMELAFGLLLQLLPLDLI